MTLLDMLIIASIVITIVGLITLFVDLDQKRIQRKRREQKERGVLRQIEFIRSLNSMHASSDFYDIEYFVPAQKRTLWEKLCKQYRLYIFRSNGLNNDELPFLSNYSIKVSGTEYMKLALLGIVGTHNAEIAKQYIDELNATRKPGQEFIAP